MKCKQARDLIGAYLYGDLAPEEMRELRVHAQDCALCREDLASRGRAVSALDDATPVLTDEERQRIAWSVKGSVRRKQLETKPLALRLLPALGIATVLVAGVAVGNYFVTRSDKPKSLAQKPPARVDVREVRPPTDKNDKTAEKISEMLQSLFNTGVVAPGRSTASDRSFGPEHSPLPGTQPFFRPIEPAPVRIAPEHTPAAPDSAAAPKDSGEDVKNPDTGTDSEATKLPAVTDPKSAETTPSESP